jgi:hypothetical protein
LAFWCLVVDNIHGSHYILDVCIKRIALLTLEAEYNVQTTLLALSESFWINQLFNFKNEVSWRNVFDFLFTNLRAVVLLFDIDVDDLPEDIAAGVFKFSKAC